MAQYIDKDAVIAMIKHHIKEEPHSYFCKCLLSELDTLEVKEVDFEEEYKEFVEDDPVYGRLVNNIVGKAIAKHFFELGLNMQQNISINVTDIDKVIEENGVDPNSKEAKMFKESYYMALEKLKAQKGE